MASSSGMGPAAVRQSIVSHWQRQDAWRRRDDALAKLFPGGVLLVDREKVPERIRRHFRHLSRVEINGMNPAQLAYWLERVIEIEARGTQKASDKKQVARRVTADECDQLMLAGLVQHHQYENGRVATAEPLKGAELARRLGLPRQRVADAMKRLFNGQRGYEAACRRGTLGKSLMVALCESPEARGGSSIAGVYLSAD